ncbi:MAG: hypothetical protein KJ697_04175 [Nanoarchaeota archaeon]|nr:hypothetical protein [Nanoarchaeota archaeon]
MSGIETVIINLRGMGFPLILLWLLTLSVVYGVLSHVEMPKSISARGVISIVAAFMVLFAAAGGEAAQFIENMVVSGIVIAFGLLIVVIFLEISGSKEGGHGGIHIFAKHPKIFGIAIIVLTILIFIGAGGLGILNLPAIRITEPLLAIFFFLAVMGAAIWVLMKEQGTKK